jgi:hypothetical protein
LQFRFDLNPHSRVALLPSVLFTLRCLKPKGYAEDPKTLGEHIRTRRIELCLTQPQVAVRLDVNPWIPDDD